MDKRIWLPVIDYEDYYEVSNDGLVRSVRSGELLDGWVNSYGYRTVSFVVDGERATKKVHRLVALAFIPTISGKDFVNHKDGDKLNNCVENLEWVTRGENNKHAATVLQVSKEARPVWQFSLDGETQALYMNATIAAKMVQGNQMMISACCKGTAKTAYNYKWRYADGETARALAEECRVDVIKDRIASLRAEIDALEASI